MKKKLFIAVLFFITLHTTSFSQGFQFGIKAGADIEKISGLEFADKFAFGYHVGAFSIISLSSTIAIQPELYYSAVNLDTTTGFKNVYQVENIKRFNYQYLNIPILLNIKANKNIAFQLGPKFGILANSNLSLSGQTKEALKGEDISAVGGIQFSFLRLKVYGRYQIGLLDVKNVSDAINSEKWTNQSIHIGAALRIL